MHELTSKLVGEEDKYKQLGKQKLRAESALTDLENQVQRETQVCQFSFDALFYINTSLSVKFCIIKYCLFIYNLNFIFPLYN